MNQLERIFPPAEERIARLAVAALNAQCSEPYGYGMYMDSDGNWRIRALDCPPIPLFIPLDQAYSKFRQELKDGTVRRRVLSSQGFIQ